MTREEERIKRYKEMQARREKVQKEKEHGEFEKFDMPEFKCLALKPNKSFPIRLMGESLETRCEKTDPL